MEEPNIDAAKALVAGSSIRVVESNADTGIRQQGTGSRRALFWVLLQVRNALVQKRKLNDDRLKEIATIEKDIVKENGKKKPDVEKIKTLNERKEKLQNAAAALPDEGALPGHILLIDEPENALHPMAVRAARAHLYALARDPNWQVMLSTHSPYFIDPLEDHTTIVRLERQDRLTTPRTFRTSTVKFEDASDKENLRALLQLDSALSEMFFGSYPIIVEGDTELAVFISAILEEKNPLSIQVTIVPARGKALISALVKLLAYFRIPFGVLHDTDAPRRSDGNKNGSWTQNRRIADAIYAARLTGIPVRHRVSVPDFERNMGVEEESKDKPILAYHRIKDNLALRKKFQTLFNELYDSEQHQPFPELPVPANGEAIEARIREAVEKWAAASAVGDERYKFD